MSVTSVSLDWDNFDSPTRKLIDPTDICILNKLERGALLASEKREAGMMLISVESGTHRKQLPLRSAAGIQETKN